MQYVVYIVSADSAANVGDLVVILSAVGSVEVGYLGNARLGAAGQLSRGRAGALTDRRWLSYYRRVLAEFGDTGGLRPTVPS
jgi:hypothetical protein